MAMVSGSTAANLDIIKNRISFREDLNDTRHCEDDGFSSDEFSDDEDSPSKDPETAEIASMERKSLKYRKSFTMLNQLAGLSLTSTDATASNGIKPPSREHLLAAKKSIDDLTAWVNAAALEGDDDPFGDDDD
ncbi:hypothetical protein BG011_001797 [Mortierella polycephala]|uniref:Uncharacterized protein n=1 Tax=Mortierella polycephala TaxID=41804 RepID=A0A9P6Q835_9FUNG|nr:hypothetical protein BG011_001797 [Mortierella polycephala]